MTGQSRPEDSIQRAGARAEAPRRTAPAAAGLTPSVSHRHRMRWTRPALFFWLFYAALLIVGGALRTYRMDLPPLEFPEARQVWNQRIAGWIIEGRPMHVLRHSWLEWMIHPWIYAHTDFIRHWLGLEFWTWGRLWSVIFGTLTVALAPLAIWWTPIPGARPDRRRRLALLFMAAMAFNPYHIRLSRMLTTEPVTLALQMVTLAFFWRYYRDTRRFGNLAVFLGLLMLSGWAKLPSLIWLPGYFLYLFFIPAITRKRRWIVLALLGVAMLAVMQLYQLQPWNVWEKYHRDYPQFANQFLAWKNNVLWVRTFLGKVVLMTTVPGLVFAVIGVFSAPSLFLITTLVFFAMFYILVNSNTYNFCHVIIPSMALAAWGIDYLLETATPWYLRQGAAARAPRNRWLPRLHQGLVAALIAALIVSLQPLTPRLLNLIEPRAEVLEGVRAARAATPPDAPIANSDVEGCFSYMLGRESMPYSATLSLNAGYYMSFRRYNPERVYADAAAAWVRWASLPGEGGCLLFSKTRESLEGRADRAAFAVANLPAPTGAEAAAFGPARIHLPVDHADPGANAIVAAQGEKFSLGLDWRNGQNVAVAFLFWKHQALNRFLPPPVREGGFALGDRAVLCLPRDAAGTPVYTFEIPPHYPTGDYILYCAGLPDPAHPENAGRALPLPIRVRIRPAARETADASGFVTLPFAAVMPQYLDASPDLWSDAWFYKNMKLEGYTVEKERSFIFSTPGRPAGRYRLTLRAASLPNTRADSAQLSWVTVEASIVGRSRSVVGQIPLASIEPRDFDLDFDAPEPFDNIELKFPIEYARYGRMPLLMTAWNPMSYSLGDKQQSAMPRAISLRPLPPKSPAAPTPKP